VGPAGGDDYDATRDVGHVLHWLVVLPDGRPFVMGRDRCNTTRFMGVENGDV